MEVFLTVVILLGCAILGYLLGSISNGIIIGRLRTNSDIRDFGSHNAGGTNAGRVMGAKWGVIVILLDMLKTVVAILTSYFVCRYSGIYQFTVFAEDSSFLGELGYILASVGAVIGHSFPIFFRFKGGKCVATYAGIILSTSWLSSVLGITVFLIILIWKKHVSLGSMIASLACVIFGIIYHFIPLEMSNIFMNWSIPASWWYIGLLTLSTSYLWLRHKANIIRLINHEESIIDITKIFKKQKKEKID